MMYFENFKYVNLYVLLLIHFVTDINMSVFSDHIVNRQPTSDFDRGPRRLIPVSTIDWQTTATTHMIPLNGLDFLRPVNKLIIQQTVELTDLMSNVESENRYTVKVPGGETIYYASEYSSSCQRTCFASSRGFNLRLYDHTQQEAVQFIRRLACGLCPFTCYRQQMEVWIPPGVLIGTVDQDFDLNKHIFSVHNNNKELIYKVVGPKSCGCLLDKQQIFQIYNPECTTQIGSIINQWDQVQVAYNLFIQMPSNTTDPQNPQHKALLLGAAFLLEYMFFENSRRRLLCKICLC